jgi:hypothetical protein
MREDFPSPIHESLWSVIGSFVVSCLSELYPSRCNEKTGADTLTVYPLPPKCFLSGYLDFDFLRLRILGLGDLDRQYPICEVRIDLFSVYL